MSSKKRTESASSDPTSINSDTDFVDLDKLSKILSNGYTTAEQQSLISSPARLTRSSSETQNTTTAPVVQLKTFSYNREHINLLAKSLNLITDSYKDVRVNLPAKDNVNLLHDDRFKSLEPVGASHGDTTQKTDQSPSSSNLKSCMKKFDDEDSDIENADNFVDTMGLVNFKPVVSFDTVPLGNLSAAAIDNNIISPADYYTEDEWYDNEIDERYQDTYVGYRGGNNHSPPLSTTSFQSVTSPDGDLVKGLQKLKILEGYSTTPYINNSALIINKKHPQFDELEKDVKRKKNTILKPRKYHLKPTANNAIPIDKRFRHGTKAASIDSSDVRARTLRKINKEIGWNNQGRSILVHISGRRHSWVALDYVITKIANNGDTLIVSCNLPKESTAERMTRRKDRINRKIQLQKLKSRMDGDNSNEDSNYSDSDSDDEIYDRNETHWKNGYTYNEVEETLNDILKYIHLILPIDKIVKLTCEVSIENTRNSFINAYNCYFPKLVVTTTKKWQHDEKLGEERSKLLADVLTSYLPVPVVIIPAKKSDSFENCIKERLIVTTNMSLSLKEKQKKLAELNKNLLMVKRPLLPFMLLQNHGKNEQAEATKINKELQLEEFITTNVNGDDMSTSEQLSSILKTYKINLDKGLDNLDKEYPDFSHTRKSVEITDLIAEQSAKYNENFSKIGTEGETDTALLSLKNVLSQGEYFKSKKIPTTAVSNSSLSSKATDASSKPPVNRTIKLPPTRSPRNNTYPVGSNNDLRRYKTLSVGDTLKKEAEQENEENILKRTFTSSSQKSDEKKKKSKFSLRKLFTRS